MAHLGLNSLQHRGQESSVIVAVDRERGAKAIKRMGLVSEAFAAPDVQSLPGNIAIGHTRYSTAGSSTIENAQPVLARFRDGHIGLAHNGNLTNASELRRELEDAGSIFTSTMDSEVLVHRMARSSAEKPEHRLADALTGVQGAYCLVVIVGNTLLAARDPRGWRPLVIGKLGDATIFASESCALDLLGATLEREVERGEIIAVDESGTRSIFTLEKQEARKCVVMVDDSIVPGTTTRGLVNMVRAAGAREVHLRVSSSPVTGPCYYGIDTPTREELIAANMSIDEITHEVGADSLGYLTLDGMLESVPGGPTGFCHACFSGDYPTPPPTDPEKLRFGCGC